MKSKWLLDAKEKDLRKVHLLNNLLRLTNNLHAKSDHLEMWRIIKI